MNITVIGSGSWGTALAILLATNGKNVTLWSYSQKEADAIDRDGEHKEFLPGIPVPKTIAVTTDPEKAMANAEAVVCAVPSAHMRETLERFARFFDENHTIISVSKGFDEVKNIRLSQVIEEFAPKSGVAALSGPTHAEEVGRGTPSAIVAASKDQSVAKHVQNIFMCHSFRVYTNRDIIGVELGGALKNIIALVAGISDGFGFGDNAKAAIMTRGMAEITRLGVAMGAERSTFSGLSGLGDLIVTCTSAHSRNRRAGILLGKGYTLDAALKEVRMVVEGVNAVNIAHKLSEIHKVEMPIVKEAMAFLYGGKDMRDIVDDLMGRYKTAEHTPRS
ncbi:MAG: NAD(P)H-dependent glycerol-3-phosphate dehydrogenase [Clostridiales bacterium]|jgi:glycerol-3-phosphate dehydrogenase (NAD(P)+)|nr:NAD(P)H-dependent glycerol-3-phosphate dehydrogenase [Clostridiales bacterium]